MPVRMFKVGDLCLYEGNICRVDAVARTYINGTMGFKDGTQLNPTLTVTPLYNEYGELVHKDGDEDPEQYEVSSGAVNYPSEEITRFSKRLRILQAELGKADPDPEDSHKYFCGITLVCECCGRKSQTIRSRPVDWTTLTEGAGWYPRWHWDRGILRLFCSPRCLEANLTKTGSLRAKLVHLEKEPTPEQLQKLG